MKKPLIVLASSAVLGLSAAPALAQQTGGQIVDYVTTQLAWSDLEDFDNALALVIAAGKTFTPNFSVEGELTTSLSKADATGAEATYWTAGAYGVYVLPMGQDFALRGRLGGVYRNIDVDTDPGVDVDDDDEFNVSFGVGGLYDLSPRMNVIAEFTRVGDDLNHVSAGVQFKF